MKNIVVTYAVDATVKTGDFENVKPHYGMTVTLDDNETPTEAFAKIKGFCDSLLEAEVGKIKRGE